MNQLVNECRGPSELTYRTGPEDLWLVRFERAYASVCADWFFHLKRVRLMDSASLQEAEYAGKGVIVDGGYVRKPIIDIHHEIPRHVDRDRRFTKSEFRG